MSIFIPWTCLLVAQLEAQPSGELLRPPCSLSLPCGRPAARRTDLVGKALRRTQTHSDALQRIPTHSKGKSDTISGIAVAVSLTRANQRRSMEIASPASHRREPIKGDQWRSHLLRLTDESQSREINGDRISCVSPTRAKRSLVNGRGSQSAWPPASRELGAHSRCPTRRPAPTGGARGTRRRSREPLNTGAARAARPRASEARLMREAIRGNQR